MHTPSPPADRADREFKDLAVLLCARDPGRRRDPDVVAQALAYHHAEGWMRLDELAKALDQANERR
ncbi:hypothetical protein [Nocardia abscessus]|uniref:hypothetical protein n=1 Tax=Nocardia abscessus TaxID=120957 RepID=UPI0012F8FC85|nr:hypothetical protein [Nocardia abscessus]MCC3332264.1 hypothetical protein [Nocardia abscessus]